MKEYVEGLEREFSAHERGFLHEQRRAADHPDVKAGDLTQHADICKLHQRRDDGDDHAQRKGDDRQRHRHGEAGQQDLAEGIDQQLNNAVVHGLSSLL